MADKKSYLKLCCSECKAANYHTKKSKKALPGAKIEKKKYCRACRKHTLHKETKK